MLDPFIGSGTTAISAAQHGRNWLGIELNPGVRQTRRTTHRRGAAYQRYAAEGGMSALPSDRLMARRSSKASRGKPQACDGRNSHPPNVRRDEP